MRLPFFAALCTALITGQLIWAQTSALNQIERQLGGSQGAAPALQSPATPTIGYLGFEPDEESDIGRGVRVKAVKLGAPAAKSGLKDGDLIVQVDGKVVTGLNEFDPILDRTVPGQKLDMIVVRDNRRVPLIVTLGNWPAPAASSEPLPSDAPPPPPPPPPSTPSTGAPSLGSPSLIPPTGSTTPSPLPGPSSSDTSRSSGIVAQPQEPRSPATDLPAPTPTPSGGSSGAAASGGASLGIKLPPPGDLPRGGTRRRGAYVYSVNAGSPAEQAGLRSGNVIVQMDGKRIDSDDDLVNAIRAARAGQEVELRFYDGDRLESRTVRLAAAGAVTAPPGPGTSSAPGLGGILGGSILPPSGSAGTDGGRLGPGAGNRPLLNRVERAVDGLSRAVQSGSTLPIQSQYDPQVMAALQRSVADLAAAVSSLEERIKAIETQQLGRTSTPPSGSFGTPATGPTPFTPGNP